jgi:flagellar L-ring protein precursor FlgH
MKRNPHMVFLTLAGLALVLLAAGCANHPGQFDPKAEMAPPVYPAHHLRKAAPTSASLFVSQRSDLFTDLRAAMVGDIITVEIVENASAKKKSDSKAERTNEFEAGIPQLLGYTPKDLPFMKSKADSAKLIAADFKSSHNATGEIKKSDSMTASIGCTVIEVSPTGNMFVRGSREIEVNGETQFIILQGMVRPNDVTAANTVLSSQLADVKIRYTGRGVLTDKQKPGWLASLLDSIWPF